MDRHDEWFTPDSVEEQIERYRQATDRSSANVQMLHDLQHVASDDTRRLAQIRMRLVEHATHNLEREPVPLQRYQQVDAPPSRSGPQRPKKQSSFLLRLVSGFAAVLVITSMLLVFTLFK